LLLVLSSGRKKQVAAKRKPREIRNLQLESNSFAERDGENPAIYRGYIAEILPSAGRQNDEMV
jgi:hypothetical protein